MAFLEICPVVDLGAGRQLAFPCAYSTGNVLSHISMIYRVRSMNTLMTDLILVGGVAVGDMFV